MSPVDFNRYNELPSLEEANARRQADGIDDLIGGPVREAFLRHGAQKAFTLYLSHRHHQVRQDDVVVKVNGTAHLMSGRERSDIDTVGNKIVPTTWMGREMLPMEFAVVPAASNAPVISPDFAADLASVLHSTKCQGLFGIDTLDEEDWTELKIGSASVVVPSNGNERQGAYIPVSFAFDDKKPDFRVHGKCGKDHKHTSKP